MVRNSKKKELRLAIPFSLFIIGTILIAGGLFFALKPYFGMANFIIGSNSSTAPPPKTSVASSSAASPQVPRIIYSRFGSIMGNLSVKSAGIVNYPVYHGDGNVQLQNGIGQFTGGHYPGEGGKIVLDAHRETFFKKLKAVKIGDDVNFKTSYGQYVYRVSGIRILKDTDKTIIAPDSSHEYLVMYTCYPFDTIGYHPERYVVYANLVSGTKVKIPAY